mmetsp:Transcript_12942/g.24507  ORF Transcript_12942/g.24507 Transcript_12942/m.24507 type:complete len:696 (+) Transcript_12942:178-2265(+)
MTHLPAITLLSRLKRPFPPTTPSHPLDAILTSSIRRGCGTSTSAASPPSWGSQCRHHHRRRRWHDVAPTFTSPLPIVAFSNRHNSAGSPPRYYYRCESSTLSSSPSMSSSISLRRYGATAPSDAQPPPSPSPSLRIAIVGGGAAGMSTALHLAPLVSAGFLPPVDLYEARDSRGKRRPSSGSSDESDAREGGRQTEPGSGAVGRDIGVGIWSTAWEPFLRSLSENEEGDDEDDEVDANAAKTALRRHKRRRASHVNLLRDLEACGSYVKDVGYRTPDGTWLVRSVLNDRPFGIRDVLGSGSGSGGNNDNGFLGLKERMATSAGSKRKHCNDRDDDHDDDYHDNDYNHRHGHNRPTIQQLSRDLGMTPHTHPHLHKFYSTPPPTLEKKRRKALRCVSLLLLSVLLVLAISSAATKGFEASRRRRAPPLPDWKEEDERLNRQKWEWEEEHGMSHEMDGLEKKPPKVMDEEAAEEAIPPPPMAAMAQEKEKEKDAATGTTTGTTTTSTTSTPPPDDYDDDKLDMIFQSVSEAYRPIWYDRTTGWTGTTYAASLLFCSSVADGGTPEYAPCPYEVYCPGRAPHHRLWGGIMDNGGESWAPVLNGENEWVQVGTGNKGKQGGGGTDNDDDDNDDVGVCELYSERYGQTPEWGYTGVADEEMTRHILCCRRHPLLEDGSDGGETQQTDQVGQEEEEEEEEG